MQVFRLMGMPDKVLAFDSLPDRLLVGLDMTKADGFPRHWKEWMGKQKRVTRIPPERNPMTGEVRTYAPIEEEDFYFYLVDWHIRVQEERWDEIKTYVRKNAPKDLRLPDNIEDLAKPLAKDKLEAVSLDPEEVTVIPIVSEALVSSVGEPIQQTPEKNEESGCVECGKGFKNAHGLGVHNRKVHKKAVAA